MKTLNKAVRKPAPALPRGLEILSRLNTPITREVIVLVLEDQCSSLVRSGEMDDDTLWHARVLRAAVAIVKEAA